jgi:hypothetical protein
VSRTCGDVESVEVIVSDDVTVVSLSADIDAVVVSEMVSNVDIVVSSVESALIVILVSCVFVAKSDVACGDVEMVEVIESDDAPVVFSSVNTDAVLDDVAVVLATSVSDDDIVDSSIESAGLDVSVVAVIVVVVMSDMACGDIE